jgi:hypothetical protein
MQVRSPAQILAHLRAVIGDPSIGATLIQTQDLAVICDLAEVALLAVDWSAKSVPPEEQK